MNIDYSSYGQQPSTNIGQVFGHNTTRKSLAAHPDRTTEIALYCAYIVGLIIVVVTLAEDTLTTLNWLMVGLGALVVLALLATWSVLYRIRKLAKLTTVSGFARSNNLTYTRDIAINSDTKRYSSLIFTGGHHRKITDRLRGDLFEIGNYQNTVGVQGYGGYTNKWGYVALKLQRNIPHLYMEPKNKKISDNQLNVSFDDDQTLQLEANFNDYFTLYCPTEYRRDAFYILTPNLMALLMDNAANYHVEIVDDRCFIYGKQFNLADESTMRSVLRIIEELSPKLERQTKNYADEYVADRKKNVVSEQGKRLFSFRIDVAVGVLAVLVIIVLRVESLRNWVWSLFDGLLK